MNKPFCSSCGRSNSDNSAFCENCGNNVERDNPLSITNQALMPETAQFGGNSGTQSGELFGSITDDAESSGSSKTGNIIIGIACVFSIFFGGLISVIIAGIIYMPFRNRDNSWIFFVIPYILSTLLMFVIFS